MRRRFDLPRSKQAERILRAMDNRYLLPLAHNNWRVIESRARDDTDMLRIIRHARQRGCCRELDAQPERLDPLVSHRLMAGEEGVPVVVNFDPHRRGEFTLGHSGRRIRGEPESNDYSRPWIPAFAGMTNPLIHRILNSRH